MKKLLDLRFVIGLFFAIIGSLLLIYSFLSSSEETQAVNQWSGVVFVVFGIVMILLSFTKDAHDEVLEEDQ